MSKCPHCQSEQSNEIEFCTKCGTRMKGLDSKEETSKNPDPSYWASPENNEEEKTPKEDEKFESEQHTDEFQEKDEKNNDDLEKDPFEMEFEDEDTEKKKPSDGIWLAIIAIVVVVTIVIVGSSKKNSNNDEEKEKELVSEEATKESPENEVKPEETNEATAKPNTDYQANASSTQKDSSGVGFDYSAKQVMDKDFSTAWIEDEKEAGIGEWIEIDFGTEKEISKLGIVPGFGRDETIYQENNRVKSFTMLFDGDKKVTKELEDKYGMQIIDFEKVKTKKVRITIDQVYSGAKYNDTPIAELDFDSDYVLNGDSAAALEYYVKNKKEQALKPR